MRRSELSRTGIYTAMPRRAVKMTAAEAGKARHALRQLRAEGVEVFRFSHGSVERIIFSRGDVNGELRYSIILAALWLRISFARKATSIDLVDRQFKWHTRDIYVGYGHFSNCHSESKYS